MTTLFISDLHLSRDRPHGNQLFFDFLQQQANSARTLYILGDLFEFWVGDDAAETIGHGPILDALAAATQRGLSVFFMRGNRDFLVGEEFATRTGCRILPDPTVIDLDGSQVLLMHGDSLCTDDGEHQQFRSLVNNPEWQQEFLNNPIEQRLSMALDARSKSELHKSMVTMEVMDVNRAAVEQTMRRFDVSLMIHGHTHRPATHNIEINDLSARRIVLGDWYTDSSILRHHDDAFTLTPSA